MGNNKKNGHSAQLKKKHTAAKMAVAAPTNVNVVKYITKLPQSLNSSKRCDVMKISTEDANKITLDSQGYFIIPGEVVNEIRNLITILKSVKPTKDNNKIDKQKNRVWGSFTAEEQYILESYNHKGSKNTWGYLSVIFMNLFGLHQRVFLVDSVLTLIACTHLMCLHRQNSRSLWL